MEPQKDNQVPAPAPRPGALVMPSEPVISNAPQVPAESVSAETVPTESTEVSASTAAPVAEAAPTEVETVPQPIIEDQAAPAEEVDHGMDLEDIDAEDEAASDEPAFQWQASEYVQHHKGFGWYALLILVAAAMIGIAVWTQQWLSIAVILAMVAAVAVYAHKPPRTLMYLLDSEGITIDGKEYAYDQFRSFAVLQDESWHAIDLEPTQRFMPRLTIIFDTEDLDGITEHLSLHLPRADRQPDLVERLTRYLRF